MCNTMSVLFSFERTSSKESGDDGEEVTPVPIPNTEVKLFSADGSWGFPPARVGRRWAVFLMPNLIKWLKIWRISSAGRAPALQAGGRRFDPVILHHLYSEMPV